MISDANSRETESVDNATDDGSDSCEENMPGGNSSDNQNEVSVEQLLEGLQEHFALFLLKLQEKHAVPRVVQQSVCEEVKFLIRKFSSSYSDVVRKHLTAKYNIEHDDDLQEQLQDDNVFVQAVEKIAADRSLITYCEQQLGLVRPVAYKISGTQESCQYIPILIQLQKIVQAEGVWENLTREHKYNPKIL